MANDIVDLVIEKESVNLELLYQELASAIGSGVVGISTGAAGSITVHVDAETAKTQEGAIRQVVGEHDASEQTAEQQQEAARQAEIGALRKPWEQWTEADRLAFIHLLAEQQGILPLA